MARNGSGTYNLPQAAFVPDTTIEAAPMNSNLSDIGAALTQSISKDGQTAYTASQPMGNNKLTGLAAGTSATDSVNLGQVASGGLNYGTATGTDTIAVTLTPGFTAYAVGQSVSFIVAATNTGAVTVNINTIGAGALTWPNGTALAAGDLVTDALVYVEVKATTPVFHLQTVVTPPVARAGGTMTGTLAFTSAAINEAKGADIASATTTDIGAATGNYLDVTGTTTITGLGTVQAGTRRTVTFTGILTLTHNATSLILPTAANITTAAGDVATFVSLGSGNWKCVVFQRATGQPLAGLLSYDSNTLGGDVAMNNTAAYFTGPTIAQGSAGTWLASGVVTINAAQGGAVVNVKLWDGTTVIASTTSTWPSSQTPAVMSFALSGYITSPAGNIRISANNATSTAGGFVYNQSGGNKDCTVSAIRIA